MKYGSNCGDGENWMDSLHVFEANQAELAVGLNMRGGDEKRNER